MLGHWLNRSGIGQLLAPDEKMKDREDPEAVLRDEASSGFWRIVAPDPNFAKRVPPSDAFPPPASSDLVLCQHCHQWTSTKTPTTPTPVHSTTAALFTPSPTALATNKNEEGDGVETLVLTAAKDTAASMMSPKQYKISRDKVFLWCGNQKPITPKIVKLLRKLLKKNPQLLHARSTRLGPATPDGFTPLMAAAYADQIAAAEVILQELPPNDTVHLERDLQGRTALHIAAERGNMAMVQLLCPLYLITNEKTNNTGAIKSPPPPVDLLGRTPLGRAVTSPEPSARKHKKELEHALFSPNDLSIIGMAAPEVERSFVCPPELQLAYGISDMPGMRVTMEDAVTHAEFQIAGLSFAILGVCDGHDDQGLVSRFVADTLPQVLQAKLEDQGANTPDWNQLFHDVCLETDANLQALDDTPTGGCTGLFALVSSDQIVVANVGDSRAVLIARPTPTVEGQLAELSLSEEITPTGSEPKHEHPGQRQQHAASVQSSDPIVVPLSENCKPGLESEQARIEKAGMKVVPITFEEDGKSVTIHKIQRTETDMMAVSRAFGDFEYKANATLGPEDQAVTAVPDVRVHSRNHVSDMYLILACDGIWDVMENEDVRDYCLDQFQIRKKIADAILPEVGDAMLRESLNRGSRDNMTAIVAALSKESQDIGYPAARQKLVFGSPGPTK